MILLGELPRPDHVVMAALEWERRETYRYVCTHIRPAMKSLGIPFSFASRKKYATVGFFGGADGDSTLLPCYTDQSGKLSKLPEWCSGEWKREVVLRWAAEQTGWKQRGVDNWVGISFDEQDRVRAPRRQWFQPAYPLIFVRPTRVSGCLAFVEKVGWPEPPRSRCEHCPNQSDAEWAELTPAEWERACQTDEYVRSIDPHAFLHKSLVPLRIVQLDPVKDCGLFGGCAAGTCF